MDGVIVIRKEKGFTSHDVVAKLRGILHMKKIGHTGTLDPDAEGVLPVALGKATRLVDMITDKEKTYEAVMRLGVVTDTQDMSGTVLSQTTELSVTEEELCKMTQICLENNVWIASDEIHCDIVYSGHHHIPTASLSEEVAMHTISFVSPSKTFNLPGFRTAVMISANPWMKNQAHEILVGNKATGENIFGTVAFCTAYEECDYYADQMREYMEGNRRLAYNYISENLPGMKMIEPEGTYLFWIDVRDLKMEQEEVMNRFVKQAKVGVQDGLHFGEAGRGFVRLNAACPRSILMQALTQIKNYFYK